MPRKIETLWIAGPAGRLEALLEEPDQQTPCEAVLVCHPHPQHGGTMHNKVVYRIARAFRRAGAVVLRFNYRGVNLSQGAYAGGVGEVDDARAALAWLGGRYPGLPFSLAGFSFGSRVALRVGCATASVSRILAVGFPAPYDGFEFLETSPVPKLFIQSTHDEFGPPALLERWFERCAPPKRLVLVPAADHFFGGALDAFEQAVRAVAGSDCQG